MEQDLPQRHVFFNFVPFFWEDAWIEIDFYCGRFQAPVLKKLPRVDTTLDNLYMRVGRKVENKSHVHAMMDKKVLCGC